MTRQSIRAAFVVLFVGASQLTASAQNKYGPGASDTEIKIGQTMPYSGPLSAAGVIGKSESAYFRMLNEQGGINGRHVTFLSLDDQYAPARTLEQTRRLVEQDEVLAIVGSFGTPTNAATQEYLNARRVPQLFIQAGASRWDDPTHFPWTVPLVNLLRSEARVTPTIYCGQIPGRESPFSTKTTISVGTTSTGCERRLARRPSE